MNSSQLSKLASALTTWAQWYSDKLGRIEHQQNMHSIVVEGYGGAEQDLFEALGCSVEPFPLDPQVVADMLPPIEALTPERQAQMVVKDDPTGPKHIAQIVCNDEGVFAIDSYGNLWHGFGTSIKIRDPADPVFYKEVDAWAWWLVHQEPDYRKRREHPAALSSQTPAEDPPAPAASPRSHPSFKRC